MQAMDLGLRDKVALVTGSSRGLGLASAKALAAEGCCISLCARTEATLHEAAREVSQLAGGDDRVLAVAADLARADGVHTVIERTVEKFGGIDVLVNNLAVAQAAASGDVRPRVAGSVDHTLMPGSRVTACRSAHAAARRRRDHHHCVDLRARDWWPNDVCAVRPPRSVWRRWRNSLVRSTFESTVSRRGRFCSRADPGGSVSRTIQSASRIRETGDADGALWQGR